MKRTEWKKESSPLGTPQFNVSKATNFPNDFRHSEAILPVSEKSFKMISKPAEHTSETLYEVLKLRNSFEETLNKIKKTYLAKERQVFQLIQNEDELKVLIATRPHILEIRSQVSGQDRPDQGRFIDDYRSNYKSKQIEDLRSELKMQNEQMKLELVQDLESFLHEKTESCKRDVEDYWVKRIEDLEEKLVELEASELQDKDLEREEYEEFFIKNEEKVEQLRNEIEDKYKKAYLAKRPQSKVLSKREKEALVLKFEAELEIELMNLLDKEKSSWGQDEVRKVQKFCEERWKEEQQAVLQRKEKDLKRQAEKETKEIINNLVKDFQEASDENVKKINSSLKENQMQIEEILKEEAYQEVIIEAQDKYREIMAERVKTSIDRDLKKNLAQRIEMEVKIRLEDSIYQELNQDLEESHEVFRKKVEQEQASKLIDLEYQCEANRSSNLQAAIDKKFSKIEKDLKINYFKKLDKLKSDLRKEYEEIYIGQIKKIRSLLIQEKSEAARIKSQINVYVNKTSNEKASQLKSLQEQEDLYDRKFRDISIRQQIEIETSAFKHTPETSKSPLMRSNNGYSPVFTDNEVSRTVPRPLPPPSLTGFNEDSKKREASPERRLLRNYDTKEIANSLILKNYEDANKQAWLTLKETEETVRPRSTYAEISELLSSGKVLKTREEPKKHSLYNELLRKKYGVIEPRVK